VPGERGLQGVAGEPGAQGPPGAPGPSTGYFHARPGKITIATTPTVVASLDLPAGSYITGATLSAVRGDAAGGNNQGSNPVRCVVSGGVPIAAAVGHKAGNAWVASLAMSGGLVLEQPGKAELSCQFDADGTNLFSVESVRMWAIKVGELKTSSQ
jgi:hypothetical protein